MECVNTSGKRKTAIARAVVKEGTGKVTVNKIPIELYTPELARIKIKEPLELASDKAANVDISVNVQGGGVMGQAAAIRTATSMCFLTIILLLFYFFAKRSRISPRSFSSLLGSGAGAGSSSFFLLSLFMPLIIKKIQKAMMRKSMMF